MMFSRILRLGAGLTLLVAGAVASLAAASDSFAAALSAEQRHAAGLDQLAAAELAQLDLLVANDTTQARTLRNGTYALPFTQRHPAAELQAAGLDRLGSDQRSRLDDLVAARLADRPSPRERPRLKDNEVVSLARRLEVHGGMSFTYGWAGGGRNFREVGAWVSYYDPVTGIELGFSFSRFSGALPYDYYDDFYPYAYDGAATYSAPRALGTAPRPSLSDRGGIFSLDARGGGAAERDGRLTRGPGGRRF